MLDNIRNFFKKVGKKEENELLPSSGDAAKERLHLVLMQDRVNVSVDFVDMMKQDMIDVVKKYIDIDENEMDVRLTNKVNDDGSNGSPTLYANIPIVGIKQEKCATAKIELTSEKTTEDAKKETVKTVNKIESKEENNKTIEVKKTSAKKKSVTK